MCLENSPAGGSIHIDIIGSSNVKSQFCESQRMELFGEKTKKISLIATKYLSIMFDMHPDVSM